MVEKMAMVIEEVKKVVESGVTYALIAKESEISSAALSQYIKGTYQGDNQAVTNKIAIWLENYARSRAIKCAPKFVETATSKRIFSALEYAKLAGCFVVIYGNSGVGKTGALREYAKRPNTWLVTARPSSAKLLEFLYDIACALDLEFMPKRSGTLSGAIQRKLRDIKGLLMIDEADHLPYEVLEEIRLIQEITGVGIVLCGNHQIYAKLSGNGSRSTDFARLFSRVAKKVSILQTTPADIDALTTAWGITTQRERELLQTLGKKPGALRGITTTLSLASLLADSANMAINEKHIIAAIKDLEGV
ncbi:AAA family ATPase [Orbaceae bacterium ESL0721]|nr:AAA family ATPase [Orbaceae bacterium ESL0721]